MAKLRPYTRPDNDLLLPYKRERELCARVPGLKEELDSIVAFVDKMRFEFREGEFSIARRHGKARFEHKTQGRKKYGRGQHQESEWAASQAYNKGLPKGLLYIRDEMAYNKGLPKGLLYIRDEMVPRIAASYAYSQDNPRWPSFSFAVAWSELCKIKVKGPVIPMEPQFGALMCISKRARQQLDLIA
ncbi:unnamed protein product [Rhizoctonia solani]|uniref:Uncharacterized protein n=1 Tax=Rhizoctonia solani TaxID=456999 RepID=A0A8H3GSB7_9AGAM|nr:unnamed protein product [Rhizoctonia solani]